jgi:carboxypeptidase C (cathepsin A)
MSFFLSPFNIKCPNYPNNLKVDALDTQFTQIYKQQTFKPYSVDGQVTGQYKNAGRFSYVRIYGAGHEVPAYKVRCVISFFVTCFSLLKG